MDITLIDFISNELDAHKKVLELLSRDFLVEIDSVSKIINNALLNEGKLLICGNGGSAADAQNMASEFTGRYKLNRKALAAIALTTDSPAITAISNDFGYENVFARQVSALASSKDIIIGISTSGNSLNVLKAIEKAKEKSCKTIALTGCDGGILKNAVDVPIIVPSMDTARIQEMHILIIHILSGLVDKLFIE